MQSRGPAGTPVQQLAARKTGMRCDGARGAAPRHPNTCPAGPWRFPYLVRPSSAPQRGGACRVRTAEMLLVRRNG
jgi:hypothetical protein